MLLLLLLLIYLPYTTFTYRIVPPQFSALHENTEVVVDVQNTEKRFYLQITDSSSPFFMYITPCGAPVHWQLFTNSIEIDASSEFAILSDASISLSESDKFRLIAGEEDTKRMSFFAHHLPKNVILVLSSSSDSLTSTRIFFSPSLWRVENQYPPLPHDTRLATTTIDESATRITWKIAAKVRNAPLGRYRICAIVARDVPEWAAQCDHVEEGVEAIRCVPNTNNSLIIGDLRKAQRYFVSVFVRDYVSGTSSSYDTQMIETGGVAPTATRKVPRGIARRQKKPLPRLLVNSKLQATQLEPKKGSFVNYKFVIPPANGTQTAMLIVHACDGLVRINIFRNGKILKRTDAFTGFRRFVVTNLRSGHLRFQLVNDDEKGKTVRIWASTNLATSPYPILPDDTSVKIVGRTCSSASIQWLKAHDANVKYCVYRRKENFNFLEQLVSLVDNLCQGGISSSSLVGCYSQSPSSLSESATTGSLIETSVAGLDAASTYRLDLLAIPLDRPNPQPLPYRTVWVRTNRACD